MGTTAFSYWCGRALPCAIIMVLAACLLVTIGTGYTLQDKTFSPPTGSVIQIHPEIRITLTFTGRVDTFYNPEVRPVLKKRSNGQIISSAGGSHEEVSYWYDPFGQTTMTTLKFTNYYNLEPGTQYDVYVLNGVSASYTTAATGALSAVFTAAPMEGGAPFTVQFTDASTGSPTSWVWNFGDGASSTLRSPSHTYTTVGDFVASLTVHNAGGASSTDSRTIRVKEVDASFTAVPTTGTAPLTVQFTDTSTGNPTSWSWQFGDGATSELRSPSHTYTAAGTYGGVLSVMKTVVTPTGTTSYTSNKYFTITVTGGSAPTVTAISPASAAAGTTLTTVSVSGTNFKPGAQVRLTGGTTTIDATGETTNAAGTQITCTATVPSAAYLGSYTVSVQNPGMTTWVSKADAFQVIGPLTVDGISPTSATRGQSVNPYVWGTGFLPGAQVKITGGTTTISPTDEATLYSGAILCNVTIPTSAYLGAYTVSVQNPGMSTWVSKAGAFTVTEPTTTLTITGISPASSARGTTVSATVSGTGFKTGAQFSLYGGTTSIYASGETTVSANQVTGTFTIPATAYVGAYNVYIKNPDGAYYTKVGAFTVTASTASPTVTGISPTSGVAGSTLTTVDVSGTNFASGAQVRLTGGTTTIDATGETAISAGQIRCAIAIPSAAYLGSYTVSVQNPGMTTWASKAGAFTVTAPTTTLTITGISPASAARGTTVSATVSGTGFKTGAQFSLYGGTTSIYASGETTVSANQVTGTFTIPATAYVGTYNVYIKNPDGAYYTKVGAFTVTAGGTAVSSISPTSMVSGSTNAAVYVSGSGFKTGAQFWLSGGGTTIQASSEALVNAGSLRGTLTIPANAYVGAYTLFVQNPGEASVSKAGAFTVTAPTTALTITGISPASGTRGTTVSATVSGTGFKTGAQFSLYGGTTSIYASGETTVSANQVTGTFTIPATAYVGTYNVYIKNPDGAYYTKVGAFRVS